MFAKRLDMTMNAWIYKQRLDNVQFSKLYYTIYTINNIYSPNTTICIFRYLHPHNQQVIIQQESSSYRQVKITKRIVILIIINLYNLKETITLHNHNLNKRRTTNHIMTFIILNIQPSLIHSYYILLL
jgi:hypothetical protein